MPVAGVLAHAWLPQPSAAAGAPQVSRAPDLRPQGAGRFPWSRRARPSAQPVQRPLRFHARGLVPRLQPADREPGPRVLRDACPGRASASATASSLKWPRVSWRRPQAREVEGSRRPGAEQGRRELRQVAQALEPLAHAMLPFSVELVEALAVAQHLAVQLMQAIAQVPARLRGLRGRALRQGRAAMAPWPIKATSTAWKAGARNGAGRPRPRRRRPCRSARPRPPVRPPPERAPAHGRAVHRARGTPRPAALPMRVEPGRQRIEFAQRRAQAAQADAQLMHLLIVAAAGRDFGVEQDLPERMRDRGLRCRVRPSRPANEAGMGCRLHRRHRVDVQQAFALLGLGDRAGTSPCRCDHACASATRPRTSPRSSSSSSSHTGASCSAPSAPCAHGCGRRRARVRPSRRRCAPRASVARCRWRSSRAAARPHGAGQPAGGRRPVCRRAAAGRLSARRLAPRY